jgi:transposase
MLALRLFNHSRSVSRPYESRKQAASASSRPLEFIGRFFDKLKHYSAVATRYDKFARNFLAGVQMACAMILLN